VGRPRRPGCFNERRQGISDDQLRSGGTPTGCARTTGRHERPLRDLEGRSKRTADGAAGPEQSSSLPLIGADEQASATVRSFLSQTARRLGVDLRPTGE
jgi:hypothetical protein